MKAFKLLVFAVLAGFAGIAQQQEDITINELKEHVYFLASDSLKGRKPGTPESKVAAEYIRDRFTSYGLKTMGDDGFQYFEVIMSVEPGINNSLSLKDRSFEMNTDFSPSPFSSNADITAGVVFAGFGFDVEEDSLVWNDYKDLDVKGKWVLALRGDPEPDNDNSLFISYGNDRDKALMARDHDAAG